MCNRYLETRSNLKKWIESKRLNYKIERVKYLIEILIPVPPKFYWRLFYSIEGEYLEDIYSSLFASQSSKSSTKQCIAERWRFSKRNVSNRFANTSQWKPFVVKERKGIGKKKFFP